MNSIVLKGTIHYCEHEVSIGSPLLPPTALQ